MPQGWEWLIILAIAVLLFGGTKLAGLGKASGRAIREFKEETRGLNAADKKKAKETSADPEVAELEAKAAEAERLAAAARAELEQRKLGKQAEIVDAEIVEPTER